MKSSRTRMGALAAVALCSAVPFGSHAQSPSDAHTLKITNASPTQGITGLYFSKTGGPVSNDDQLGAAVINSGDSLTRKVDASLGCDIQVSYDWASGKRESKRVDVCKESAVTVP